jgi:hypothetical protein
MLLLELSLFEISLTLNLGDQTSVSPLLEKFRLHALEPLVVVVNHLLDSLHLKDGLRHMVLLKRTLLGDVVAIVYLLNYLGLNHYFYIAFHAKHLKPPLFKL